MPNRRTLHAAAYSSAMAAALLILWAAAAAARRERLLEATVFDCENDLRILRHSKRHVEAERAKAVAERDRWKEGVPQVPTDTLVVVTEKGYLCPTLGHPAGAISEGCDGCDRFRERYPGGPPA